MAERKQRNLKTRNSLTQIQTHRLVEALMDMKAGYEAVPITASVLAEKVSARVGFTVTAGNIYHTGTLLGYDFSVFSTHRMKQAREAAMAAMAAREAAATPPPAATAQPPASLFDVPVEASPAPRPGKTIVQKLEDLSGRLTRHTTFAEALEQRIDGCGERLEAVEGRLDAGMKKLHDATECIGNHSERVFNGEKCHEHHEGRLQRLEADNASLRQLVVKIYQEFGVTIPA